MVFLRRNAAEMRRSDLKAAQTLKAVTFSKYRYQKVTAPTEIRGAAKNRPGATLK
jgi:hypothetical protein